MAAKRDERWRCCLATSKISGIFHDLMTFSFLILRFATSFNDSVRELCLEGTPALVPGSVFILRRV